MSVTEIHIYQKVIFTMKAILFRRTYCVPIAKTVEKIAKEKLDFNQITNTSKIPNHPIEEDLPPCIRKEEVEIDKDTVQLLERLSLVNLDGEEALKTLKSSIQFAKRIEFIDTKDIKPLYTVLEDQPIHLRSDTVSEGHCREDILRNAKIVEEDYFISPPGNIPLKQ